MQLLKVKFVVYYVMIQMGANKSFHCIIDDRYTAHCSVEDVTGFHSRNFFTVCFKNVFSCAMSCHSACFFRMNTSVCVRNVIFAIKSYHYRR